MTSKKNNKIYEPFEKCKGLKKKRDYIYSDWHDPMPGDEFSYAYYVIGFANVIIIYDSSKDEVIWAQINSKNGYYTKKKGVKVWEAMTPYHQKLFLFNIDWFLGN